MRSLGCRRRHTARLCEKPGEFLDDRHIGCGLGLGYEAVWQSKEKTRMWSIAEVQTIECQDNRKR